MKKLFLLFVLIGAMVWPFSVLAADDVELNDRRVPYTASASQTVFDIDFPIEVAGDVVVYQNGALVASDDYTVDVSALTVTLDTGASDGDSIVIDGDTDPIRPTAFPRRGALRSSVLNADFRRVFYILQEQVRNSANNIALSPAQSGDISTFLPVLSEGRLLIWGAAGIENGPTASDIENAQTNAEAAATAKTAAEAAQTAAEAAAASVNLPTLSGNADNYLRVNSGATGYEHRTAAQLAAAISPHLSLNSFETGDTMWLFASSKSGWLSLDGSTIGDTGSGADSESASYEDVYAYLWDNVADTYAPVSTGRGASAAADWAAGKTITLPDARGRSIVGAGLGDGLSKTWAVGEADGDETKTLIEANLPSHTHGAGTLVNSTGGAHTHSSVVNQGGTTTIRSNSGAVSGATTIFDVSTGTHGSTPATTSSGGDHTHTISGSTGSAGSGSAFDVQNPALAANWFIKI